jgi:CBS domain containing-hemolysin-like protein
MDQSTALGLFGVVLLVAANGFFVATEFAIVAVRRSKLEQLEAEGHGSARAAKDLVDRLDVYIAACQLGITMASLALGWVGEPALAHLLEPPLTALVGQVAPAAAHGVAIAVTFAIITALHIVLGEQVPKLIGLQHAESTTLFAARPMQLVNLVFGWPIALLNNVSNAVMKLIGLEPMIGHGQVHSVEELLMLVTGSQRAGVVEASEARIARRAFFFADRTAGELMTPRTELEAVPIDVSLPALLSLVRTVRHSRLPVFEGSIDNIVGVLHVHDLFSVLDRPGEAFDLRLINREALIVPFTRDADELLEEMQARRIQLAVVLDEYGGTAGVVTIEDLVEALVGRIEGELLPGEGLPEAPSAPREPDVRAGGADDPTDGADGVGLRPEPDGSVVLGGQMRLWEFEELTGLRLPESDHEDSDTLGGLIMARLGRIPVAGDEIEIDNRTLRVEQLDGRRVAAVRLLGTIVRS